MKKVDLLREKLAEYEVEDFGYLGDVIVLFANSERWNSLSESARSEIFDQKLYFKDPWHVQVFESEKVQELADLKRNMRNIRWY
jgi:hypothetical protein